MPSPCTLNAITPRPAAITPPPARAARPPPAALIPPPAAGGGAPDSLSALGRCCISRRRIKDPPRADAPRPRPRPRPPLPAPPCPFSPPRPPCCIPSVRPRPPAPASRPTRPQKSARPHPPRLPHEPPARDHDVEPDPRRPRRPLPPAPPAPAPPAPAPPLQHPTLLFLSPTVISGDPSSAPYVADVLVHRGLIAKIAPPGSLPASLDHDDALYAAAAAARRIDANGWVLSPGFIDMHAHSDLYLLTHPDHEAKISQGCTTEVVGQDGISYAPTETPAQLHAIREQIAGWNGNPREEDHPGVGLFQWTSVGGYLDCLERNRTATNVAMLVPQGNLRLLACGPWDRVASRQEITKQEELLRVAMREGAIGMSSGLTYTPGMYASTSELASLCRVLGQEFPGAFYAPHHRSYGFRALESYGEMLGLGRDTGCAIHLTHATLNFSENKGRAPTLLSMIDAARASGVDVSLDTYPYLPGCTTLAALLPSWASAGGPAETLSRLEDEVTREKVRRAIEDTGCDGGHGIPTNWEEIQIGSTTHPDLQAYSGRRVAEVARAVHEPPIKVFFDVLLRDKLATSCIMHIGNEENVQAIMRHETHCSGSDAILHGKGTHPRAYGTFPRFLGHYARDLNIIPLPSMIAHLTSRPAKRLGIYPTRGLVAEGSAADLVLFDPQAIRDTATYELPKQRAEGIRFVLVNGEAAMDEGRLTGARGGAVLRRRADGTVV